MVYISGPHILRIAILFSPQLYVSLCFKLADESLRGGLESVQPLSPCESTWSAVPQ